MTFFLSLCLFFASSSDSSSSSPLIIIAIRMSSSSIQSFRFFPFHPPARHPFQDTIDKTRRRLTEGRRTFSPNILSLSRFHLFSILPILRCDNFMCKRLLNRGNGPSTRDSFCELTFNSLLCLMTVCFCRGTLVVNDNSHLHFVAFHHQVAVERKTPYTARHQASPF